MAKRTTEPKIDTPTARTRLEARREPYWNTLAAGLAMGYRRGVRAGSWIARAMLDDGERRMLALGAADDKAAANGIDVLSWRDAKAAAERWRVTILHGPDAAEETAEASRAPTVAEALELYFAACERAGKRGTSRARQSAAALILPVLGGVRVDRLRRGRIEKWLDGLAASGRRVRAAGGSRVTTLDAADEEAVRRRRATSNRVLAILKAALTHAVARHPALRGASGAAWGGVRPFRAVSAARIVFLSDDEARRLVNACGPDLRALVRAALLTGCRFGELAALRVRDYSAEAGGSIRVAEGAAKSGKARSIWLDDDGRALFEGLAAGKTGDDRLLLRGGAPWGKNHHVRAFAEACAAARVAGLSFHGLRHAYAARLVRSGVPMAVVAAQLGHADTRMTERHYAHLRPDAAAALVRGGLAGFGLGAPAAESNNVEPLRHRGR